MNEFVEALRKVERLLAEEEGAFNLFALFLREDAPGKWDLLVASPWIEKNKASSLKTISDKLRGKLTIDDLVKLSRVVLIDQNDPALAALQGAIHVEHGDAEIRDSNFFGLQIKHAHVITSKRSGV